jgi:hypothetical protein
MITWSSFKNRTCNCCGQENPKTSIQPLKSCFVQRKLVERLWLFDIFADLIISSLICFVLMKNTFLYYLVLGETKIKFNYLTEREKSRLEDSEFLTRKLPSSFKRKRFSAPTRLIDPWYHLKKETSL